MKRLIPLLMVLLLVSTSFMGVSNTAEELMLEESKQLMIDSHPSSGLLTFGKESVAPSISGFLGPIRRYSSNNLLFGHKYVPGEFIIKFSLNINIELRLFKDMIVQTGIPSIDQLNKKYQITAFETIFKNKQYKGENIEFTKIFKFILDKEGNIFDIIQEYIKDDHVEYAEPNYIYSTCAVPNDPFFDMQWALHNTGQTGGFPDADIDATEAWDIETGNENVRIAILDTGIDWNHPDLADNIWVNSGEDINGNGIVDPSDFDGIDTDGNGFVDDIRGWDFVDLEGTEEIMFLDPDEDGMVEDNDPMDFHGHGTHCAGISAAVTDNSIGVAGVCWNCKIMPIRAGWKTTIFGSASLLTDDIIEGIVYAADMGADVISMSFGGKLYSQAINDAVDYAFEKGVMLVAAAGNDNKKQKFYPAAYDNVIAVAATDHSDNKATFSNYGRWIDIAAPGVDIESTLFDDTYVAWNGTSMACPHVAGLVALLLSKNHSLSADMVKTILFNTVDNVDSTDYIGRGRINAFKAVQREPAIALLNIFPDWTDVKGIINITGTAWGEKFKYYTLGYYRKYNNYGIWKELINSTSSVQDDVLATLDTTYVNDSLITIQLSVICDDGIYHDSKMIVVNNEKNNFIVDDDNTQGPWSGTADYPFQYINNGVKNAGKDDCVFVCNGTYYENITIYASITLTGESLETTVISGYSQEGAIYIESDQVEISGFTITNFLFGIYLERLSKYNIISENNIINNGLGILLSDSCCNNVVCKNYISQNLVGIDIEWSSNGNNISSNNVANNSLMGVGIGESVNNMIFRNKITNNNFTGLGLVYSSNNSIYENIISDHKMLVIINNKTKSVGIGIYLILSPFNNSIYKNTIAKNDYGITIQSSSFNEIICNNFIKNKRNARFISCSNTWDNNYWNRSRFLVKLIFGRMGKYGFIPWVQFDWRPALKPYDT